MKDKFSSILKNKNMAYISSADYLEKPKVKKRVAFILLENFSMMAFTGAVDALVTTNLMKSTTMYEVLVVGSEAAVTVSDLGIEVAADYSLDKFDATSLNIDVLIVCGGLRVLPKTTPLLRNKLRHADTKDMILGGYGTAPTSLQKRGY
ncbi:DJ-1/PfpI family protein [Vreelandella venusta]|uniref:DJ-1/PfpI family protein n=1 Tax=Vreelandella venusta TaxID=44935 RepID=UPI002286BD3D|nr:DJ-1/PfpI family protein [Halomonas venusta]WAM55399.1 DJ-1/PfpI family protein [Halomonas venusta]